MRAEDLFEAMGGIDEELIARSDKRVRSSQKQPSEKKGGRKRSSVSRIYRFAVITMTTAAAVFLFLMVRDFVGSSRIPDVNKSQVALGEKAASAQSARGLEENDMIAEAVQAEEEAAADEAIAEAEEAVQEEEITRDTAEDWLQEGGTAVGGTDGGGRTAQRCHTRHEPRRLPFRRTCRVGGC